MNYLDSFRISFGSLPIGEHEFEFEIDDKFFEHFQDSVIRRGFADILVTVNRQAEMLLVDFTTEGSVTIPCDRCGDDMDIEIAGYNELIVKFGDGTSDEEGEEKGEEDQIVLSPKEHELNVAQFIYEYVTLMVPMRNVHPENDKGLSTCNPIALRKLEALIHHEPTPEETEEGKEKTDPRWDILKSINLN
jgi:uncharacterized metal-binding protein YceD (DUF177 family)